MLENIIIFQPGKTFRVSQEFGERPDVYKQFGMKGHNGIDFACAIGTPLYSPFEGVCSVKHQGTGAYGLSIRIKNDKYEVIFAHLSEANIKPGQVVLPGTKIGKSGNSGFSTGPHLHFGIREYLNGSVDHYSNGYYGWRDPRVIDTEVEKPVIPEVKKSVVKKSTVKKPSNKPTMFDNKPMFEIIKSLPRYDQAEVEGRGNGDCLPYNMQFASAVNTKRNYPEVDIEVDHQFDEHIRVLIGRSPTAKSGLYAYYVRGEMQRNDEFVDIDGGDCLMRVDYKSIRKVKNNIETYEKYIKLGIPVVMGMTFSSASNTHVLWDDTPMDLPLKHEITLVGFAENGDGLWYDTSSKLHDPEGPPSVKRIDRKLLETKGNAKNQGVNQPFVMVPKVFI